MGYFLEEERKGGRRRRTRYYNHLSPTDRGRIRPSVRESSRVWGKINEGKRGFGAQWGTIAIASPGCVDRMEWMDDRWHTSRNRVRAVFTSGLDGGLKLLLDRNRALGGGSRPELGMEIWIGRLKLCTTEGREVSPGFGVGCCSSLPEWPLESVGRRKREHRVRNRYRRPSQNRYQFLVRVWWEERWVERWALYT